MTMTDGERAIVAQLKRIADALGAPVEGQTFADPNTRRFAEGGLVGPGISWPTNPGPPEYIIPRDVRWQGFGSVDGVTALMDADRAVKRYGVTTDEGTRVTIEVPTESSNRVWERIMRDEVKLQPGERVYKKDDVLRMAQGEGDHLLNPDADHTGEDLDG